MATPSDLTYVGSSKPCQSAQTRKTSEQACIYIYVKHVFSFIFFLYLLKILIIYIKKTVSCCLQTVTTQKFLPFQSSDFVNILFETHLQV